MTAVISIVDDDKSVREATKALMRSIGYAALAFSSAEEFLASERVGDTACVITDLHMPGLSGVEMQSRLIARGHNVPIIFITAYPDERQHQHAIQAGAICFIAKPYRDEHLIGCIDRALRDGNAKTA